MNNLKHYVALVLVSLCYLTTYAYDLESNGIYYNIIKSNVVEVTKGNDKYKGSINIPETFVVDGVTYKVTQIGSHAFYGCSELISVIIPNSVTSIGYGAFRDCSITSMVIPDNVTEIGEYAFYDSGLTSVTLGSSISKIGNYAFRGCSGLTSVYIKDLEKWCNVDCVDTPFWYATDIYINGELTKDLVIPNSITSIGSGAFIGCKAFTSITIGNSVTKIGDSAFSFCSCNTFIISDSVTDIGEGAFFTCHINSITLGSGVKTIDIKAFESNSGANLFNSVHIKDLKKWLEFGMSRGENPFMRTENIYLNGELLTDLVVPNTVTILWGAIFESYNKLISVTIPNSVTEIRGDVFKNCTNLKTVSIGNSVNRLSGETFAGCKSLETVYCYAEKVPSTQTTAFKDSYIGYTTLIVPEASVQAYKSTAPWSEFGTFKTTEGGTPEIKRCEKPVIAYEGGELVYTTSTDGATVVSEVTVADAKKSYDLHVPLTATYNITAHATKSGYDDSEMTTATLVWATATLTTDQASSAKSISVDSTPLLITQSEGILTVSGLQDGDVISAYSADGKNVATSKAIGNAALLNLSELQGKVAVLNVAGKSAKIMVK